MYLLCKAMLRGSYIRKWYMHVACNGWCAWVKAGSYGPSNSAKGSVRRCMSGFVGGTSLISLEVPF